jgi:hypothetical protein
MKGKNMNTFIEKNKEFLKFYHAALRLSGWILLTLGLCGFGITILIAKNLGPAVLGVITLNTPLSSLDFILFGLLGLGIAQLIRYLFDCDYKPGFILRYGSKFLYAYVILILIVLVTRNIVTIEYLINSDIKNSRSLFFATSIASIVLFAAKALILIGVAQFLKRVMSIIEEYKSLV